MESYNITYVTPEMYGYKDRGIKKWQGMILTDQSETTKKVMAQDFVEIEAKEEMTEEAIANVLYKAYVKDLPIAIQANIIRNGKYYKDVICKVKGYGNGRIYLRVKDGRKTSCTIGEIKNVEFIDPIDWYDKRK